MDNEKDLSVDSQQNNNNLSTETNNNQTNEEEQVTNISPIPETTISNGIGLLLLVDRGVNGLTTLSNNPSILKQFDQIYLPKQISIYNQSFAIKKDILDSTLSLKKQIIDIPNNITKSFLVDITPYISFIFSRFNEDKYVSESIKFINNTITSLSSNIKSNITKWIVMYILDDTLVNDGHLLDRQLFGYCFLHAMFLGDQKSKIFGDNLSEIILCHNGSYFKIYDKTEIIDYAKVYKIFNSIKPNITFDLPKSLAQDTNSDTSIQSISSSHNKIDNDIRKSYNELIKLSKTTTNNLKSSPFDNNLQFNKTVSEEVSKAIITKIEDDQYKSDREIPVIDPENEKDFFQVVNKNNNKMFPFLNSTKQKNNNITDIPNTNKLDRTTNERQLLTQLVPMLSKNSDKDTKEIYDILRSKFERNPDLLTKALISFEKKDFKELMTYINESRLPYTSKIYPKKDEVDRTILKEMDDWSADHGYSQAVGSDSVLTGDIISNNVVSNMHRVMAQKQLTWNNMPKEIEANITKLLEDNGFQLIDITMEDKKPPITEIEPTYKTDIKIKIRNKHTRTVQTLVFEVYTLIDEITAILSMVTC